VSDTSLEKFTNALEACWGPVTSALTLTSKQLLEELAQTCQQDCWYAELVASKSPDKEIYRSDKHGFILMGHVENMGDISPPHDHGAGWVLYSTVTGQVDMGIYHKVIRQNGKLSIVQKDAYALKAGQCSVYLAGDIHDTHTVKNNTVMLRLTSCDFHQEVNEGRLVRFTKDNVEKWR
jgi:hypothetical protein